MPQRNCGMWIELPEVVGHPNRLPFEGCMALLDVPSDKSPAGARGHRVIVTRAAAEKALPSLLGMAVNYTVGLERHNVQQKCGVVIEAWIDENRLMTAGYLYERDFPELKDVDDEELGMSCELATAHVRDYREEVWTITQLIFTGAAILPKSRAAYRGTSFRVAPLRGCRRGPVVAL